MGILIAIGMASLAWIAASDARRMIVPVVPLLMLFGTGLWWALLSGAAWLPSLVPAACFILFWLAGRIGEGDVLLLFALAPWFELREYAGIMLAGFIIAVAWGLARLARARSLKGWVIGLVTVPFSGKIPDTSEEALDRPDCVPLATCLAAGAFPVLALRLVGVAL